jgi:Ca-activated chloride channel family protein
MRAHLPFFMMMLIFLWTAISVQAAGLLIPTDRSLPPLALQSQSVKVAIDGQIAQTTVQQSYLNSTSRELEAEYVFPLPRGAAVSDFSMWIGDKKLKGETLPAAKAKKTYEQIVARLRDPALLEYVDRDVWKVRVFPIPPHGVQKIEIKYTQVLGAIGDLVSYEFPLHGAKTPGDAPGSFSLVAKIKSDHPLGPIYSPSHEVSIDRKGEREAVVGFETHSLVNSKNFLLYYSPKSGDVGFSLLANRPHRDEPGYFVLLLSPKPQVAERSIPRDLVLLVDASGSMNGEKMTQAKGTLNAALATLRENDRFAIVRFATVVDSYRDRLAKANPENIQHAREWIESIDAVGGTDIAGGLEAALALREPQAQQERTFQILLISDGVPTVGTTDVKKILQTVESKNSHATRVFSFGVGYDVDTYLLDQLSESTRAATTYVRPDENLEVKASAILAKIKNPVRSDLKLETITVGGDDASKTEPVKLSETYPPKLPDLFAGDQLQIVGRYSGSGKIRFVLHSKTGDKSESHTFDADLPARETEREFVATIWARRKIGYLLDQIRLNGVNKELEDEIVKLATKFGVATPYTSWLVVPDESGFVNQPTNLFSHSMGHPGSFNQSHQGFQMMSATGGGMAGMGRGAIREVQPRDAVAHAPADDASKTPISAPKRTRAVDAASAKSAATNAQSQIAARMRDGSDTMSQMFGQQMRETSGRRAVDVAQALADLKTTVREGARSERVRVIADKRFHNIDGVWIDDSVVEKSPRVRVKFVGESYFKLLDKHPEIREILALGDRIVWRSPAGSTVLIDDEGEETLSDAAIDQLFQTK